MAPVPKLNEILSQDIAAAGAGGRIPAHDAGIGAARLGAGIAAPAITPICDAQAAGFGQHVVDEGFGHGAAERGPGAGVQHRRAQWPMMGGEIAKRRRPPETPLTATTLQICPSPARPRSTA